MKKAQNSTSIKVFTRLRPLNRLEKEQGGECCVQYTDKAIKVKVSLPALFCVINPNKLRLVALKPLMISALMAFLAQKIHNWNCLMLLLNQLLMVRYEF